MTAERNLNRGRFIPLLFMLGDIVVLNVIFAITLAIFPDMAPNGSIIRELWLSVNVAYFPVAFTPSLQTGTRRAIRMENVMKTTFLGLGLHLLVFLCLLAFLHIGELAARVYFTFYGLLAVGWLIFRLAGASALKAYRRKGFNFARVVIVGTGPTAIQLYEDMKNDPGFGYAILGFFDDVPDPAFHGHYGGNIDDLAEFMAHNDVRQVFFTLSGHNEALAKVIKIADDNVADFLYVPQIPRKLRRGMELHSIGTTPVLSIRHNPLKSTFNRIIKRTFDIVVSGIFLIFYPLIYIPVAIGIKLSSPGPVYFRQERTGYRGRSFQCLKFRTMKVNAAADKAQATKDDPRKTRFGDFLRRTSIDELPQFINVLKGEMSVVGPRPHMLKHTEEYTRLVDSYMVRHTVKPGITGWAQVNGYRGITDELWKMEKRVECDVWYIENWSLLLDVKIVIRTIINALKKDKNAF